MAPTVSVNGIRRRRGDLLVNSSSLATDVPPRRDCLRIRETAQEHGLNADDFLRMAEIESAFDPVAYHPVSRASDLFQFLPSTARQYQLSAVFNARANAKAAAAFLKHLSGDSP